jgi:hypothetical protein
MRRLLRGAAIGTSVVVLVALLAWLVVRVLPAELASTGDGQGRQLVGKDRAEEIGRTRTALLAVVAGLIATAGAIFTGLSYRLSRLGHELDRQGQVTDRFTRAIDQLDQAKSVDVRLGGIYALERLARESPEDHGAIMEILSAYLREHALGPSAGDEPVLEPAAANAADRAVTPGVASRLGADVSAVLTVIGRRNAASDIRPLDLTSVWAPGAGLTGATLRRVLLNRACLQEALLIEADLEEAQLVSADLRNAFLQGAKLHKARLTSANLRRALENADLSEANLRGSQLHSAWLQGTDLATADLRGAVANEATKWPEDFDWRAAGVREERVAP